MYERDRRIEHSRAGACTGRGTGPHGRRTGCQDDAMSELTPQSVDAFLAGLLARDDEVLAAARRNSDEAGLPPIAVSATQGKFLGVLARAVGARRILEIGTLGGYSTIWLARALVPGGRLVTLEYSPEHAEV